MSIAIKCSGCGKSFQLRDDLAGKRVKCKCGQTMVLPRPESEADDAVYGLAPLDTSDPAGMLDAPPPTAGGPVLRRPAPSAAEDATEKPAQGPKRKAAGKGAPSPVTSKWVALGTVFGLLGGMTLIALVILWLIFRPGFASPEDAFAARQQAILKKNWNGLIRAHSPQARETVLSGTVTMLGWMLEMIERPSPAIEAALEKHGVGGLLDTDDLTDASADASGDDSAEDTGDDSAEDTEDAPRIDFAERTRKREERRKQLLSTVENKVALFVDLVNAIEIEQEKHLPHNPMLKVLATKPAGDLRRAVAAATLGEVNIDGDSASSTMTFRPPGKDEDEEVSVLFKKVKSRWYVHVPGPEEYDDSPFPSLIGGSLLP